MARASTQPRATLRASSSTGQHEWLVLWPSTGKGYVAITNDRDEVQRLETRDKRQPVAELQAKRRRGPVQTAIWRAANERRN